MKIQPQWVVTPGKQTNIAQAHTESFIVSRTQQHTTENACHSTDVTIISLIQVAIRRVPTVANKCLLRSHPSVCPHVARLHVDGFARNFILGVNTKIRRPKPKLVKTGQKISGTLHEDLRTFYFCRRNKFAIKAFPCSSQYVYTVDSDV